MCDKIILGNLFLTATRIKTCNKAVDIYAPALGSVLDCYKTQKMCDKALCIFPSTIKFVLDRFKIQKVCDKVIDTCQFILDSVPDLIYDSGVV